MDEFLLKEYLNAGNIAISQQVMSNYHKVGMTNDELLLYLQIESFKDQGISQPSINQLAQRLYWDEQVVSGLLKSLKEKKLMIIDSITDAYDFTGLMIKIIGLTTETNLEQPVIDQSKAKNNSKNNLLKMIEVEFGRPLSPMQIQQLISWFDDDKFNPELIKKAVEEAVLNGAYNFNYIEKILINWQKNNVQTVQQAQIEKANFQQKKKPVGIDNSRTDFSIPLVSIEEMDN